MKRWERLVGRPEARSALSVDDWLTLWNDASLSGLVKTTMGATTDEELVASVSSAYKTNGPIFALTLARLQVFSQARFQWTRWSGGRPTDMFGTDELAVLERPWRGATTADLLARMEVDVTLAGSAFVRRITRGAGRERVDRLARMSPQNVVVIMGSNEDADHPGEASDTEIVGFVYRSPRSRDNAVLLGPEEVALYAPYPDPDNHFLGMSWVTPVIREVQSDAASELHKRKFFQNAATPNLAIKFDPTITIQQVREFKSLLEEEHRGAWNAYKTLYLGGGADPVAIGKDFAQLEFAATQGKGESRLASAAGVPPSWVGFSEGLEGSALNAGNFSAARRRFADGTLHHLWGNAAASLQEIITPPDAGARLWYDLRSVPFLREDAKDAAEVQQAEATTITQLVKEGFTPESAIKAVQNSDWSLLQHTGLVSVQLQPPGAGANENGADT